MAPAKQTPKAAEPKVETVPDPVAPQNADPSPIENHDETDVAAAMARKTQDGKGEEPVPPGDFHSFATKGVEKGSLTIEEISQEVLDSKWGWDWRQMVEAEGYNASQIQTEVNRRIATGAPSGLPRPSVTEVARQVLNGEWGETEVQIRSRLDGAGHVYKEIANEVSRLYQED